MRQYSNLRATIMWAEESADYWLGFQVVKDGKPMAEVATLKTTDPELQQKIRDIAQAFRMGQRFPE